MSVSEDVNTAVEFKGRCASKKFPEDTNEDKQLILNMCLYASDNASPTKQSIIYFKWLATEMEEYYQQGDLERKLDFTISPFFDRTTCNPFKFQIGYIDVIVMPLFTIWCQFKPAYTEDCITKGLLENKKLLESKVEETKNLMQMRESPGRDSFNGATTTPNVELAKLGSNMKEFNGSK